MFSTTIFGQMNLVPNPSFEDTISCPTLGGEVSKAEFWYSLANTPDYLNACCVLPNYNVPSNIFGFQNAHSGNAYMGLCTYSTVAFYREIIGAYLLAPLIVGQKYYVNFKVSTAYSPFTASICAATSGLGILFSTVDYISTQPSINNYAQVYCDTIISDTVNWTTIKGSFIADSAYTFISIGNFFDDQHTDTICFGFFTGYVAYYYVDDVCISTDSLYSEIWTSIPLSNKNKMISIFPNPVRNVVHIENIPFNATQIDIISINGKTEFTTLLKHNNNLDINTSNFQEGLYIAILRKENEIITQKKFIKSNN